MNLSMFASAPTSTDVPGALLTELATPRANVEALQTNARKSDDDLRNETKDLLNRFRGLQDKHERLRDSHGRLKTANEEFVSRLGASHKKTVTPFRVYGNN